MSPKNLIFEKEVTSVFVEGNTGEYELLSYHYPLVGIIKESDIVIDQDIHIPVRSGILRFYANECSILVEETPDTMAAAKPKTSG